MTNVNEIWLPIVDFEGYYEVSNLGRVRSVDRYVENNSIFFAGKIKRPKIKPGGYLEYNLKKEGTVSYLSAHRIVAMAFIPNPENKPQVNHLDGVTVHNFVFNLEWATSEENLEHSYLQGIRKSPAVRKINQLTLSGEFIKTWDCIEDVIRSGVARKPAEVAQGKRKHSGGFLWEYA